MKKFRADSSPEISDSLSKIKLVTNHYHLDIPKCLVYHYDVKIDPGRYDNGKFLESFSRDDKRVQFHSDNNRAIMREYISLNQSQGGLFYDDNRMKCLLPVFDGRQNLYTVQPIPSLGTLKTNEKCDYFRLDDKSQFWYRIRVRFATEVDFAALAEYVSNIRSLKSATSYKKLPHDAVRALDIILRSGPSVNRIPIGSCIFPKFDDAKPENIGRCKHVISGHYQTIRPTASGLSLVIDRSSTTFYKACDLVEFIRTLIKDLPVSKSGSDKPRNIDPLSFISLPSNYVEKNLKLVESELNGLTFEVTHTAQKMKFKIRGLTRTAAHQTFFTQTTDQGEQKISVADFFMMKYSVKVQHQNLPCVISGNTKRPAYYPLEVCQLVQNQKTKKFNQKEMKEFIKSCSQSCDSRFKIINDFALTIKQDNLAYLHEFSLDLSEKPIEAEGICLDKPKVSYKDELLTPELGKWTISNSKILNGCQIGNKQWFIVNLSSKLTNTSIKDFVEKLRTFSRDKGASIGEPEYWCDGNAVAYDRDAVKSILRKIHDNYLDKKHDIPSLVMFVITRSKDDSIYQEIKRYGDLRYGIPTQCIVESNLKTSIRQNGLFILSNIFLKLNAKCGGINHAIDGKTVNGILGESTLIMGADVTHPTDGMSFSVAACVSSLDEHQTKYGASIRLQRQLNEEIILDLPDMVYELLRTYIEKNNISTPSSSILPERLIFYRDGVSDGQFSKVMEKEIARMPEAFEQITQKFHLNPPYRPKVTFIVVQKRHNTRLKPVNSDDSEGKAKNVPSGTLVTQKIVSTTDGSDFFLCSHSSMLGTSKPSHYYVLSDENNFGPEVLHHLTFSLCHMYAKCTRAISIPAPVQYAHLAAFRARLHLMEQMEDRSGSTDIPDSKRKQTEKKIRIHHRLSSSSYFV